MLTFHATTAKREIEVARDALSLPPEVTGSTRSARPCRNRLPPAVLGIEVPSFQKMSEIETSSRLYPVDNALFLTTPMVYLDAVGALQTTPLGFVLAKENLLAIRFKPVKACDHRRFEAPNGDHPLPAADASPLHHWFFRPPMPMSCRAAPIGPDRGREGCSCRRKCRASFVW